MKTACFLFFLSVVSLSAGGRLPSYQTHRIVPEKELMITDTRVVDSSPAAYPGPFSFGYFIEELAGARGVAAFLEDCATLWEEDQTVNAGETQTDCFHIVPRAPVRKPNSRLSSASLDGPTELPDPSRPSLTLTLNEMTKGEVILAAVLDRDMRANEIRRLLRGRVRQGH